MGHAVVWPVLAIYWTLGNFLKPLATINLPKSPTVLGNFCVGAEIYHFYSEIIFGQLLWTFGDFSLLTLKLYSRREVVNINARSIRRCPPPTALKKKICFWVSVLIKFWISFLPTYVRARIQPIKIWASNVTFSTMLKF